MYKTKALFLGSSGSGNDQLQKDKVKLSFDNDWSEEQKSPLAGIFIDLEHFKEMYDKPTILWTSKYNNKLLSIKFIKEAIRNHFDHGWNWDICQFYYSGHAYYNGDFLIQTKQHPDGERLTIQQIMAIYCEKYRGDNYLYLYIDCCFAGKSIARLQKWMKNNPNDNLSEVYCSSGINYTSLDVKRFGGLLVCRQWARKMENYLSEKENKELKAKFESRKPIMAEFWDGETKKKQMIEW